MTICGDVSEQRIVFAQRHEKPSSWHPYVNKPGLCIVFGRQFAGSNRSEV